MLPDQECTQSSSNYDNKFLLIALFALLGILIMSLIITCVLVKKELSRLCKEYKEHKQLTTDDYQENDLESSDPENALLCPSRDSFTPEASGMSNTLIEMHNKLENFDHDNTTEVMESYV